MSRTLYPSIRSDTGYNTMQQPGAQVSHADSLAPPLAADSWAQDPSKPTIEMSACSPLRILMAPADY